MLGSVYIFKHSEGQLSVYPNDSARAILKHFISIATAAAQVVTHRSGKVMYYGYIRKLRESEFLGFCILVNGVYVDNMQGLMRFFERNVEQLSRNDEIIRYDENGELRLIADENSDVFEKTHQKLFSGFSELFSELPVVPPETFSIGINELSTHLISDSNDSIIKDTIRYGYTLTAKQLGVDTSGMLETVSAIRKLKREKEEITSKHTELQKKYTRLVSQKKQYRFVALLILALIGCGVCLYILNDRANESDTDNRTLQSEVAELRDSLNITNGICSNLKAQINSYCEVMPIIITDARVGNIYPDGSVETEFGEKIYSNRTMYLKPRICFTAYREGEIKLEVRLRKIEINQDSIVDKYEYEIEYTEGSQEINLRSCGWSTMGCWAGGTYKFEFWYMGRCLFVRKFTVFD